MTRSSVYASVTSIFADGNKAQGPLPRSCQAHLDLVRKNAAMISWINAAEGLTLFPEQRQLPAAVWLRLCWWDRGHQATLNSERDSLVLLQ